MKTNLAQLKYENHDNLPKNLKPKNDNIMQYYFYYIIIKNEKE